MTCLMNNTDNDNSLRFDDVEDRIRKVLHQCATERAIHDWKSFGVIGYH